MYELEKSGFEFDPNRIVFLSKMGETTATRLRNLFKVTCSIEKPQGELTYLKTYHEEEAWMPVELYS